LLASVLQRINAQGEVTNCLTRDDGQLINAWLLHGYDELIHIRHQSPWPSILT
jgi:hypothetical protein